MNCFQFVLLFVNALFLRKVSCQGFGSNSVNVGPFRSPFFPPAPTDAPTASNSNCDLVLNCDSFFRQKFPPLNGTCNNRVDPKRGIVSHSFKRLLKPNYNRLTSGQFSTLPGTRVISNQLQDDSLTRSSKNTQMLPLFGQFIAHDLTRTLGPSQGEVDCACASPAQECLNIPIPRSDQQYSREKTCFQITRSSNVKDTENCDSTVRQQGNLLTGFFDMGLIYGTSEAQKEALREKASSKRGELVAQNNDFLLPQFNQNSALNAAQRETSCSRDTLKPRGAACFISGEPRTNENSVLMSHHTIWMRLHNRVVRGLKRVNPSWNSDQLFETARTIVIALEQRVTYQHFLPEIIGPKYMQSFKLNLLRNGYWYGYDSSYDATISNSFAAAAFRMGHPLINELFRRPSPSWSRPQGPSIRVRDSFTNVGVVSGITPGTSRAGGPNSFIRGLASESSLRFDTTFSDDLRNFLNSISPETNTFGSDLLARNINRGRDHGLPSYVSYRRFCGLSVPTTFSDMRPYASPSSIQKLRNIYRNIEDVDLYAGGIAENSVQDGTVGDTFACIIAYQFRDAKVGDRFWHENPPPVGLFSEDQLAAIRDYEFSRILCDVVSDMSTMQPRPLRRVGGDNQRRRCRSYKGMEFGPWQENNKQSTREHDQDTEWTSWFPLCVSGQPFCTESLSVSETYNWLLVNRPTEVCRQVVGSEERKVGKGFQERSQVRFQCLPGIIAFSDFPPIPNDKFYWSQWTANPQEFLQIQQRCGRAYAIQGQTRPRSGEVTPVGQTNIVFNEFSPFHGVSCYNNEQENIVCPTVFVRLLCRQRPNLFIEMRLKFRLLNHQADEIIVKRLSQKHNTYGFRENRALGISIDSSRTVPLHNRDDVFVYVEPLGDSQQKVGLFFS